jgi:hypothetical protein
MIRFVIAAVTMGLSLSGCASEPTTGQEDKGKSAAILDTDRGGLVVLQPGVRTPDGPGRAQGTTIGKPTIAFPRFVGAHRSLEELVRSSEFVFVGRVVGERRGPVSDSQGPDLLVQSRLLDLEAEEVIKGGAAAAYEITQYPGWNIYRNRNGSVVESEAFLDGTVRLAVGDRGVFGLNRRPAGGFEVSTHTSLFLFSEGRVKKTKREGEFVEKTEQKNETQLLDEIRKAAR